MFMSNVPIVKSLLIFLLACISLYCKSNGIDKLKTIDDVDIFLKHLSKQNKKIDFFSEVKKDSTEKLSLQKFIKIDLNNDGFTDLVVNGTYLFVVIDDGKNQFNDYYIDNGPWALRKYVLADIDKTQEQPKIIIKNYRKYQYVPPERTIYDTIVFKFNGLVDYTDHPELNKIKEISISTSLCFGPCPEFDLKIDSAGMATYNAKKYTKKKGLFKGTVDKATLNNLFNLTNYIRIRSLRDKYAVTWTDDQTIFLTITFIDGSTKNITDYGLIGTFGLANLYNKLYEVKNHTKWKSL